jgi:hypothetical protein
VAERPGAVCTPRPVGDRRIERARPASAARSSIGDYLDEALIKTKH